MGGRITAEPEIPGNVTSVEPYDALARIYDRVMAHVDYVRWAGLVMELLEDYGCPADLSPPPQVLECACGTGTVAGLLAARGYRVSGFDRSAGMLRIARSKSRDLRRPPRFRHLDFLSLKDRDKYDAALCLYDSVNYLMSLHDLADFFRRLAAALKPQGLFLFDICTEFNSLAHFKDGVDSETGAGFSYTRKMHYHSAERIQENLFRITTGGKTYIERHLQRIYPAEQVRDTVRKSRFTILEETDEFLRRQPTGTTMRIHFVCRRE